MPTKNEEAVLEAVRKRAVSPRELEQSPPPEVSGKDVRVAVQRLVSSGAVAFDNSLKLVIASD